MIYVFSASFGQQFHTEIEKCFPRKTMKRIWENRTQILEENLEHDGYRNQKLRCRKKKSPTKTAFENRLAQVILIFSGLANIGWVLVQDLAKGWFN